MNAVTWNELGRWISETDSCELAMPPLAHPGSLLSAWVVGTVVVQARATGTTAHLSPRWEMSAVGVATRRPPQSPGQDLRGVATGPTPPLQRPPVLCRSVCVPGLCRCLSCVFPSGRVLTSTKPLPLSHRSAQGPPCFTWTECIARGAAGSACAGDQTASRGDREIYKQDSEGKYVTQFQHNQGSERGAPWRQMTGCIWERAVRRRLLDSRTPGGSSSWAAPRTSHTESCPSFSSQTCFSLFTLWSREVLPNFWPTFSCSRRQQRKIT